MHYLACPIYTGGSIMGRANHTGPPHHCMHAHMHIHVVTKWLCNQRRQPKQYRYNWRSCIKIIVAQKCVRPFNSNSQLQCSWIGYPGEKKCDLFSCSSLTPLELSLATCVSILYTHPQRNLQELYCLINTMFVHNTYVKFHCQPDPWPTCTYI